jgi:hypothetical protein
LPKYVVGDVQRRGVGIVTVQVDVEPRPQDGVLLVRGVDDDPAGGTGRNSRSRRS